MMKRLFLLFGLLPILFLQGCIEPQYLTEQFIKNNIETHKAGNTSAIRIYSIYQATCFEGKAYIEFSAYKFNGAKGLVITADPFFMARHRYKSNLTEKDSIEYLLLNTDQCKGILDNYKDLQQKIKAEKPKYAEDVYEDFTVSKDIFISYCKALNGYGNITMNVWVRGHKFPLPSVSVVNMLNRYMNY